MIYDIFVEVSKGRPFFFVKAELKKANIKVFQMHSKGKSMILQITPPQQEVIKCRHTF